MVQKVFGIREAKNGKMMKRIQTPEDGRVPAKEAKNWRIEGQKKNHEKGVSETCEQV